MSSSSSRQTGSQGGWTSGHLSHCVSLSEGSRGIKSPLDSTPDGRSSNSLLMTTLVRVDKILLMISSEVEMRIWENFIF